jgi:beta-N-acetylhexosaminidase
LINQLQAAAYGVMLAPEQALNPPLSLLEAPDTLPLETPQSRSLGIPLLIGIDQAGDGLLRTSLRHGFTPVPPEMALGASWNPELARALGEIVGREMSSVGVNLLLGPTLDVLDQTRPDIAGGAGIYALGSDPFWVSLLGRAYIEGIHTGSQNRVATIANHFPGQGGSDRRPGEEVATIQKSLEALRRVDFQPFFSVTQYPSSILRTDGNPAATDGLMSSHSRYSSIQGSRERTPPISQATELGTILGQDEFAAWRQGGGLVMTDALGVPAVRRAYDPTLQEFPSRLIALNSFLAGNDLLYLSRFALTDDWEAELANIKETIRFFEERYANDPDFAARVDGSLKRVLRLKLRLYIEEMPTSENVGLAADAFRIPLENVLVRETNLSRLTEDRRAESLSIIGQVARESITLLYPDNSATSLPSPPQPEERILIFTDSRELRECATCPGQPAIAPDALASVMTRLYGPGATNQIDPNQLETRTFAELKQLLDGTATPQQTVLMERELESASWVIFAMLDVDPEVAPDSDAVKQFLRQRGDRLTKKNIVVFAFNAPYFLDATEISKLTAYYGVYSKIQPFVEAAVRALFRGFPITGAPPLSVPGTRFDNLAERLQPDPDRTIDLRILNETAANGANQNGEAASEAAPQTVLMMGDTLNVEAGPILDRNGNPVPDGTPVNFTLIFEGDELALPTQPALTRNGLAVISVLLDRGGVLRITAASGDATSDTVVVNIQGEETATETPTATPQPSLTPPSSLTPSPSSPGEAGGPGENAAQPVAHQARLDLSTLMIASLTMLAVLSLLLVVLVRIMPRPMLVHRFLWAIIAGWTSYILYGLGLIPGISSLQSTFHPWVIAPVVLIAMLIPLVWLQLRSE